MSVDVLCVCVHVCRIFTLAIDIVISHFNVVLTGLQRQRHVDYAHLCQRETCLSVARFAKQPIAVDCASLYEADMAQKTFEMMAPEIAGIILNRIIGCPSILGCVSFFHKLCLVVVVD